VEELYGTRYQSDSFSFFNVGSGFHCLRSFSFFFFVRSDCTPKAVETQGDLGERAKYSQNTRRTLRTLTLASPPSAPSRNYFLFYNKAIANLDVGYKRAQYLKIWRLHLAIKFGITHRLFPVIETSRNWLDTLLVYLFIYSSLIWLKALQSPQDPFWDSGFSLRC